MNEDILKGTWLEIKGRAKEKLAKLTDNDLGEIEGKKEKLLGILQKKHGYIRDKAELEYKDSCRIGRNCQQYTRNNDKKERYYGNCICCSLRAGFVS